ncbi:MAG: hypothetical protein Hyperionvirus40_5 [Hyperionvirus sp.]|uniref:Uncharacterized protein n=1 Tax=Hyperionvirus sp. TaxID=2487770 RepID=A0A3G5AEU3_9VIRU|nr:MAG: hypothetical protein Hyperionvirus40_5 [Hyperionvirus sp.]
MPNPCERNNGFADSERMDRCSSRVAHFGHVDFLGERRSGCTTGLPFSGFNERRFVDSFPDPFLETGFTNAGFTNPIGGALNTGSGFCDFNAGFTRRPGALRNLPSLNPVPDPFFNEFSTFPETRFGGLPSICTSGRNRFNRVGASCSGNFGCFDRFTNF